MSTTTLIGMTAVQHFLQLSESLDLSTPRDVLSRKFQQNWSQSGTGEGQVNLVYHDTRVVSYNTHDDISLIGSLQDAFGNSLVFKRVKSYYLRVVETMSGGIISGNSVANTFAPGVNTVTRGGVTFACNPNSQGMIVNSGAHLFRVSNMNAVNSVHISYDVIITGCSS